MDDPTLLIHWLFSCLTMLIMGTRMVWRKASRQGYNLGDYLTLAACVCCLARLILIHLVLTWGTSNVSAAYRETHKFTDAEIHRREVGSKLSLANRVFYNSYLWLQKLVLLDVYRRLLMNLRLEKLIISSYLTVFFGTYVATQVTTFSECKPFHLYWQVLPDPGPCAAAQLQLIVVGVTNIVTDFMLLILPIPLVLSLKKTPWQRKLRLFSLFLLGIFIVAITIIRLPINASNKNSQVSRTTWASIELLTAAIVVNAPTLYGLWNKRRQAKSSSQSGGTGPLDYSSRHSRFTNVSAGRHKSIYDEEFLMVTRSSPPADRIVQTKEVIVSQSRETGEAGGYVDNFRKDAENASNHSSQKGILKD